MNRPGKQHKQQSDQAMLKFLARMIFVFSIIITVGCLAAAWFLHEQGYSVWLALAAGSAGWVFVGIGLTAGLVAQFAKEFEQQKNRSHNPGSLN